MVTRMQLEQEQIGYLKLLIEDDLDRARDHLKWLTDTPEGQREADRDQQIADTVDAPSDGASRNFRLAPPLLIVVPVITGPAPTMIIVTMRVIRVVLMMVVIRLNDRPIIGHSRRLRRRNGCGERCPANSNGSNSCERCRKYNSFHDILLSEPFRPRPGTVGASLTVRLSPYKARQMKH